MKTLIGLTLIAVLILIGQRKSFVRLRMLYVTGTEFLVIGFLLGDHFVGLLDQSALRGLAPVIGLGLGWIGFLYGLQFEWRVLRRFPAHYFVASQIQAIVVLAVVFPPAYLLLKAFGAGSLSALVAAAVVAAAASCSAPTVLALMSRDTRVRRLRITKVLNYVASVDDLPGLTVLGVAFSFLNRYSLIGVERFLVIQWLALSLGLGVLVGFLFAYVVRYARTDEELLVVLLGAVFLGAGTATYLNLSPLFVNLVAGVVVVNVSTRAHRIVAFVHHPERPIYLAFLVVAGAGLGFGSGWVLGVAAIYMAIRSLGKLLGGAIGARTLLRRERVAPFFGLGLTPQGGMSVAMIVGYQLIAQSAVEKLIVTGVLVAIVMNELLSPALIRWVLRQEEGT